MSDPFEIEITTPDVVESHTSHGRVRRVIASLTMGAVTLAGGVAAVASLENDNRGDGFELAAGDSSSTTDGVRTTMIGETSTTVAGDFDERQASRSLSDEELAEGGYNCGKGLDNGEDGKFEYTSQIGFLNENPELAKELVEFNINDSEYGMGEDAWDFLRNNGAINPYTPPSQRLDDEINVDGFNRHMHQVRRVELQPENGSVDLVNFTCDGGIRPVGVVEAAAGQNKNALDGIVVTAEGLLEFAKLAENRDRFVAVYLGKQDLEMPDGTTVEQADSFLISLYFDGCRNPNRRPVDRPDRELPPHVIDISKVDDGILPGDGTDASQDPGTPDEPGEGPAGQDPGDDGYLPQETKPSVPTTTTRPSSTTSTSQPTATTGTQPTAPSTPPTTGTVPPNTGTMPPKPEL